MINELKGAISQPQFDTAVTMEAIVPMGMRLDRSLLVDENFVQLYESMKKMWEESSHVNSMDAIKQMRNFTNAEGQKPYNDISTHTAAIAQVMEKLEGEIGRDAPFYILLNESLGFAVVSNGILNSFLVKMRERPEDPEPW